MQADELIRARIAEKMMGATSRTTAWRRQREDPDWPARRQVGPSSYAYLASEVQHYIESRPVKDVRRNEPAHDDENGPLEAAA